MEVSFYSQKAFPNYLDDIPQSLGDILSQDDMTYKNDTCPSFGFGKRNDRSTMIQIFIEHPDKEMREFIEEKRVCIFEIDSEGNTLDVVIMMDTVSELEVFIKQFKTS